MNVFDIRWRFSVYQRAFLIASGFSVVLMIAFPSSGASFAETANIALLGAILTSATYSWIIAPRREVPE